MKRVKKITKVTLKYFVIPSVILIFTIIVSVSATFYFFPKDKVISILTSRVEKVLDRKVHISDIKYRIGGFSLRDIMIMDDKKPEDQFLSADEVSLRVSIPALLKGNIEISGIRINGLKSVVSYETDRWNIESLILNLKKNFQSDSESTLETKVAYIAFDNAKIHLKSAPDVMNSLIGEYIISGTINSPGNDPLIISDCSVIMPFNRGVVSSRLLTITPLSTDFKIRGDLELEKCVLGWLYKWGDVDFLPFSSVTGKCTDALVSKNDIAGNFEGYSYLKNNRKISATGGFTAQLSPVLIKIKKVNASVDSSNAAVSYVTASTSGASFSISSMNVKLNEILPLIISINPTDIDGHVTGSLDDAGINVYSQLSVKNFAYGGKNRYIEFSNAEINIKNGALSPLTLDTTILGQTASLSIASPKNVIDDTILNIDCPRINLNKLPIPQSNSSDKMVWQLPIHLRGTLTAKNATYDNFSFSDISAIYDTTSSGILIPRFSIRYFEALAVGKADVILTGANRGITLDTIITGFKVQRIGEHYKDIEGRFFGLAKGKATISIDPFSGKPLVDTIQGKCSFIISNGKVVNTGIQNQLGTFLDPLKFKLRDLEFNAISGNLIINGQTILLQSMIFNSPDVRLICDGSLYQRNILNSKMTLEFNNSFIQDLPNPALLTINKYKKGRWYTVNFSAKGKISDNNYNIDIKD